MIKAKADCKKCKKETMHEMLNCSTTESTWRCTKCGEKFIESSKERRDKRFNWSAYDNNKK